MCNLQNVWESKRRLLVLEPEGWAKTVLQMWQCAASSERLFKTKKDFSPDQTKILFQSMRIYLLLRNMNDTEGKDPEIMSVGYIIEGTSLVRNVYPCLLGAQLVVQD